MSDTAIWKAGVLGLRSSALDEALAQRSMEWASSSPQPSTAQAAALALLRGPPQGLAASCTSVPLQAPSAAARKPPYAPPFEVAKLPAAGTGSGNDRGSGRSSSQGSLVSSSRQPCRRVASEGRFPQQQQQQQQQHADSRVAVSHARLSPLDLLEKHPNSLLANARAPAPLPRFVAAPDAAQRLKYAPPTRDLWEYENVAPRDVVQVVRLESKPYTRKGRKEFEQDVASQRFRSKIKTAGGIYGPLVQMQERDPQQRPPPRGQSLPALNAARSAQLSMSRLEAANALFHGSSPQRLMAIS